MDAATAPPAMMKSRRFMAHSSSLIVAPGAAIAAMDRGPISNRLGDGFAHVLGARRPSHVARARAVLQHALDRRHDRIARGLLPQVLEHHRTRPDLADGIGDLLAVD